MARKAASTISERTFLRCSRQRSLRASTFTPGSSLDVPSTLVAPDHCTRPDTADLLRPSRRRNDYRCIRAFLPARWVASAWVLSPATADRRDEIHDAAIRPGHRRWRAFGFGRRMAGRADRRESSGPGQGPVPARQALRRRPDRARGQLPAEDGPGRRGRHLPPGQPGDGVQPERSGSCRSRSARACPTTGTPSAATTWTPCCSSTPSPRAPRCARAPRSPDPNSMPTAASSA